MKNNIKSLTWKYFIQQKLYEISMFIFWIILGILVLIIIPITLGFLTNDWLSSEEPAIHNIYFNHWLDGIITMIFAFIILFFLWKIFLVFFSWIQSNWEMAKERAKRDVRRKK